MSKQLDTPLPGQGRSTVAWTRAQFWTWVFGVPVKMFGRQLEIKSVTFRITGEG